MGLNSLLLTVIAVAAGIPARDDVFGSVSVVVVLSIVVHGAGTTPVLSWHGRRVQTHRLPEDVAVDAGTLFNAEAAVHHADQIPRMSPDRLANLLEQAEPVTVIDVRREAAVD